MMLAFTVLLCCLSAVLPLRVRTEPTLGLSCRCAVSAFPAPVRARSAILRPTSLPSPPASSRTCAGVPLQMLLLMCSYLYNYTLSGANIRKIIYIAPERVYFFVFCCTSSFLSCIFLLSPASSLFSLSSIFSFYPALPPVFAPFFIHLPFSFIHLPFFFIHLPFSFMPSSFLSCLYVEQGCLCKNAPLSCRYRKNEVPL